MKVKFFKLHAPGVEKIEGVINAFLTENEGKIDVRDIKYTHEGSDGQTWGVWTALIEYELK